MSNKFKGKALNHNVIVKEKFVDNKTKHGIDLTGIVDANEKQKRGIVVSIGELCPYVNVRIFGFRIPFWKKQTIKLGDDVTFDKYKSTPYTENGVQYIIIYYPDISVVN